MKMLPLLLSALEKNLATCSVGILESKEEEGILEIGVPLGVIAAAVPALSPVFTSDVYR